MDNFKYTPINELFARKICSKPTFYKFLKEGRFPIYKFGRRSFVILEEFQEAFQKVTFADFEKSKS
jgi:hypothetical protein